MSKLDGDAKAKLILTAGEVIFKHGLPALGKLVDQLKKKDVVTVEDIEAVKGELDSAQYFK